MPDSLWPHGLQPTRLLCPWDFPGWDTGVGYHFLLQAIFPTQGSNPGLLHCRPILYQLSYKGSRNVREGNHRFKLTRLKVKSLSRVRPFATPWTAVYHAPPSVGFSRQEYWSGLPFPSPGDLPDPGIKLGSPSLQADSLLTEPPGKPAGQGNG